MARTKHVTIILRNLHRATKDAFKAYCYRRGVSMKEIITEFMQKCAKEELESKLAIIHESSGRKDLKRKVIRELPSKPKPGFSFDDDD